LRGLIEASNNRRTELSIELKSTHRMTIKVIDVDTKEVIREISVEKIQQAAKALPFPTGILLDESL